TGLDGLTPHDLRHTAASLAIDSGATVLAVSRMLGHSSPVLTLTTYAHLFDATIDELADRMNGAFLEARGAPARPGTASAVVDIRSATDEKAF
nr:tyrosine-type recombinase/integrase [Nocardioidaceae bacterium]